MTARDVNVGSCTELAETEGENIAGWRSKKPYVEEKLKESCDVHE